MGRKSLSGSMMPIGRCRIRFDFRIDGVRYRPSLPWVPHEAKLRRAREYLQRINGRIEAGNRRSKDLDGRSVCWDLIERPTFLYCKGRILL